MNVKARLLSAAGLFFILSLQTSVFAKKKLKFCVVKVQSTEYDIEYSCFTMQKLGSPIQCVIKTDRVSCLKLLVTGKVDFTLAEPQDLLILGTEAYNKNLQITHELRLLNQVKQRSSMQLVVIIRGIREANEDIEEIRKEGLCMSTYSQGFSKFTAHLFPNSTLKCSPNKTIIENRISSLSDLYGTSCFSGKWSFDPTIDRDLKKMYPNLCGYCSEKECDVDAEECSTMSEALCMIRKEKPRMAWSELRTIRSSLRREESHYYFLCRDHTTMNIEARDPCTWLEKPWRTIVARKEVSEELKAFVASESEEDEDTEYDEYSKENKGNEEEENMFMMLLEQEKPKSRHPTPLKENRTPADYLNTSFPEFYLYKGVIKCNSERVVTWCVTTNLEFEKCQWLSKAADSFGVQPFIKCLKETSRDDCMKSVETRNSDIFAVQLSEYIHTRKKGLKPIVNLLPEEHTYKHKIVAIVRRSSNINSFMDFKDKKACFAGFRDAGWNVFLYIMKYLTHDNNWYADDKKMVSKFFSKVCVTSLSEDNNNFPRNLYSFCSNINKMSTYENQDQKALDCLISGGADVAFVNLSSTMDYYHSSILEQYTTLNIDGLKCEINFKNVGNECYLTWTTLGSLVVNMNISKVQEDDIYMMLINLHQLFGHTFSGVTPLISLYGPFEGHRNVIFLEKTQSMKRPDNDVFQVVPYSEILDEVEFMFSSGERNLLSQHSFLLMILLLMYIFLDNFER